MKLFAKVGVTVCAKVHVKVHGKNALKIDYIAIFSNKNWKTSFSNFRADGAEV